MTTRIVPQIMRAEPAEATAAAKAAETARVANDRLNQCPICSKTLVSSEANGIPVGVCVDHAIVMPMKDPQ